MTASVPPCAGLGLDTFITTSVQFTALIQAYIARVGKIIDARNIALER